MQALDSNTIPAPAARLLERNPHLRPVSASDLKLLKGIQYVNVAYNGGEVAVDYENRRSDFDPNQKQVAVLKVTRNDGTSEALFDLREAPPDPRSLQVYMLFRIVQIDQNEYSIGVINRAWLSLKFTKKYVYIWRIDNFYRELGLRVGSALVQFAVEKSIEKGLNGRVQLKSKLGSALFYFKLGFVCKYAPVQKAVEQAYWDKTARLDGGKMYLPEESIKAWKQIIAISPIILSVESKETVTK